MAVDASIPLQIRPFQMQDPLERYGNALQIQGAQQANALRAQQMQQAQADRAEAMRVRETRNALLAKGLSPDELEAQLMRAGDVDTALKLGKDRRENRKNDAAAGKDEAETQKIKLDMQIRTGNRLAEALATATDQQSWTKVRDILASDPEAGPRALAQIPTEFDPQFAAVMRSRVLPHLEQLKLQRQQFQDTMTNENNNVRIDPVTGRASVNQGVIDAKSRVAAAGATQTPVQIVQQPDGTSVAVATKINKGQPEIVTTPIVNPKGEPLKNPDKPLPEAAQKQLQGTQNLQSAIGDYRAALEGWKRGNILKPSEVAKMGTAYNNMMLQAKEAYNLGVLNGPDYEILQSVVRDPTKLRSLVYSNEAMDAQAAHLDRIAKGIEQTVYRTHNKQPPQQTQPPARSPSAPAGGVKFLGFE